MPVQKFRTFDEASRALAMADRPPAEIAARVAALWAFSASLAPPMAFRGVRKYRSIDEADEDRRRLSLTRPARG